MTVKQKRAVEFLRRALSACGKAGLTGGVYNGSFFLWPVTANPDPRDSGAEFMGIARRIGDSILGIDVGMPKLDGGSGGW